MAVPGRELFKKYKPLLDFLVKIVRKLPKKIRKCLFKHYRSKKGVLGIGIRYILVKSLAKKCGENVSIHSNCYIYSPEKLELGNNVSIHPMCYIDAEGGVTIGNDVSIAHSVTILSTSHNYSEHDVPIKYQGCAKKSTRISDNVWLGAKVTVTSGVTIGEGVVVGANSVVTKDIRDNVITAGAPARIIKER